MVTDISATLKKAIAQGKHPKCIKMSPLSMAYLVESLRRNDEERRAFEIMSVDGIPHVFNPRAQKLEKVFPKEWEIEDTVKHVRVSVPLEVSDVMPDGVFATEYDDKPFEKVEVKTKEERMVDHFMAEGAKEVRFE